MGLQNVRSVCAVVVSALVLFLNYSGLANAAILPTNFLKNNDNGSQQQNLDPNVAQLFGALHSTSLFGRSVDAEVESELLQSMIFPSYLDSIIKDFKQFPSFEEFVAKLLDGVDNVDCKAHVVEWVFRVLFKDIYFLATEKEKWVLHMVDSWGKPPEGVLSGHVNAYGDFDECVNIEMDSLEILKPIFPQAKRTFEGRYCTVYMSDYNTSMQMTRKPVPKINTFVSVAVEKRELKKAVSLVEFLENLNSREGVVITPSMGVCMPNSCQQPDVQQILVNALTILYKDQEDNENYPTKFPWPSTIACYEQKKPDFDAADYSVMALLGTITALCLAAGVIDYWLNHGVAKPPKRGAAYNYLMAFSLYTNIRKWMSTRRGGEDLGCLHGIRFFSTAWVVLAHTYYVITFLPQWNMIEVKNVYEDWSVLTVINSTFAVDTFFVLSGMLVGYNILKVLDKTNGKLNILMLYLHRYLRLTPTYAILIGIMATIIPYLGNGPYWAVMTRWGTLCEDNWWTNLLYVNNFVNTSWLCQGEAWYLANDMQFYIVSPFILYPMWRWEILGLVLLAVYTILSILCPALLVHFYDTTPTTLPTRDIGKWFTHIYIRPYARIQTFLVGIWLAWVLHKTRGKQVKLPKFLVLVMWTLTTVTAPVLLYSIQNWFDPKYEIPKMAGLAYAGLSRVAWGLVVAWVMFACIKGYGGLVNSFLSWSPFMPLGRLCYCVYLVSLHLQMILHIRFTQPMRYDRYTQVNFFFAHMLMSFIVGFFCTLLFESPFMILQKLIFEGGGGRPAPAQNMANVKRPSIRYGIFYNDVNTIINGQPNGGVTAPSEKERQD